MILLTGATGYLGTLVLARLLEEDGPPIVCPVRAADAQAAAERMDGVLRTIWREPSPATRARIIAVPADLADDLHVEQTADITQILHCAASVSFELPLDEAREVNVEGTRRVLELAGRAPHLRRLVHVSTAYVAGRHAGTFSETDRDVGQEFRNTYEQTKLEAEELVASYAPGLPVVIARPSIVVGEAPTGWTTTFNVLYPLLRAYRRGILRVAPAAPDGLLDVVTGDYVADALVRFLDAEEADGTYHVVAGINALTVATLRDLAAQTFGLPPIELGGEADGVYVPYFDVRCRFDDLRARGVLRPAGICPRQITAQFPALMRYADDTRWGKQPQIREDALAAAAA